MTWLAAAIRFVLSPRRSGWAEYKQQLVRDRVWWACQESTDGCHWPENCTPGDCRKVR